MFIFAKIIHFDDMKKALVFLAFTLLALAACKREVPAVDGRVIDTTIASITLLTPAGDTCVVSTRGTNPMMVPGVLAGDDVRVIYEVLPDGETLRAVQLIIAEPSPYRLVPGIWRDCSGEEEVGLVLAEDGSAKYVGEDGPELRDWSLDGDKLALTASDGRILMYQIESLGADSLVVRPLEEGLRALALSRSE